jgi:hypothetical protein
VVNRFSALIISADLTMIGFHHFRTLCQLSDGVYTLDDVSGKTHFTSTIENALAEQLGFLEEIAGVKFADDTPESRLAFLAKMNAERQYLEGLAMTVRMLSDTQAMALLERIEEVLYTSDEVGEHKCKIVFDKMQERSRL